MRTSEEVLEHILDRITVEEYTECWLWSGSCNTGGYGHMSVDGKDWLVDRLLYTILLGPVPKQHHCHHMCYERLCVNPNHLQMLTASDHMKLHNEENKDYFKHEYNISSIKGLHLGLIYATL